MNSQAPLRIGHRLTATMRAPLASLLLASLLLTGCGGGFVIGSGLNCDSEMAAARGTLGFPDQVDQRIEGGIHIHTFLYIRSGLAVTFLWSGDLPCERRDVVVAR